MDPADLPGSTRSGSASAKAEGAGGYILAGLLIFGGVGVWLDRSLNTNFLTPLGIVVGCLAGGYLVYLRVVRVPTDTLVDKQNGSSSPMVEGDSR